MRAEMHRSERHAALEQAFPSCRLDACSQGRTACTRRECLFAPTPIASRAVGFALAFALGFVLFLLAGGL